MEITRKTKYIISLIAFTILFTFTNCSKDVVYTKAILVYSDCIKCKSIYINDIEYYPVNLPERYYPTDVHEKEIYINYEKMYEHM